MAPPVGNGPRPPPINDFSAGQLAGGKAKVLMPGDDLTDAQKKSVIESFKNIPLKDLAPDALEFVKGEIKKLEAKLGQKIDIDFDKATISSLPGGGQKIAQALLAHIKKTNTPAYAALIAGGAGAAGYMAYTKGSAGLNELGIPTHVGGDVKGFDLKLATTFKSGFDDVKVTGGAGRKFGEFGKLTLDATGSLDGFEKGSAKYTVGKETNANAGVTANDKGVETVSGGVTVKAGRVTVSGSGSTNVQTGDTSGNGSVNVDVSDNVKASVNGGGTYKDGKTTGRVSGQVTINTKNTDVVVTARADEKEKYVGVGVKVDLDRAAATKKKAPAKEPSVGEDVMIRAQTKGAEAVKPSELRPKGMPEGNEMDPSALAGDLASRIADAAKSGKTSVEIKLPADYAKLGPAERKQIAEAVAKIAKAVAAEVPNAGDVHNIKISFGKNNEYAAL